MASQESDLRLGNVLIAAVHLSQTDDETLRKACLDVIRRLSPLYCGDALLTQELATNLLHDLRCLLHELAPNKKSRTLLAALQILEDESCSADGVLEALLKCVHDKPLRVLLDMRARLFAFVRSSGDFVSGRRTVNHKKLTSAATVTVERLECSGCDGEVHSSTAPIRHGQPLHGVPPKRQRC